VTPTDSRFERTVSTGIAALWIALWIVGWSLFIGIEAYRSVEHHRPPPTPVQACVLPCTEQV
jgi:hypothetical protein